AAWGLVALAALADGWLRPRRLGEEDVPPDEGYRPFFRTDLAQVIWIAFLGAMVVGLTLYDVSQDPREFTWPAGMLLGLSAVAVGTALWQRREGWFLLAGLGVNLAVSLLLWERYLGAVEDWWVHLVQANVIAASLMALLWLVA